MNALDMVVALCMRFEGFRALPYLCPAGVPTIGYGSTYYKDGTPVTLKDAPISRGQADQLLRYTLVTQYIPGTIKLCPDLNGRGLSAIADFVYNLGVGRLRTSTLRKRINEGNLEASCHELDKWVRGGGRVLPGLVARRKAEIGLMNF